MQDEKVKISAIIKTRNSENTICTTLESIRDIDEIILIDEHSSDDTVEIAKEYKAKIIYSDILEFNSTLKKAIDETRNDWIFLIEEDEIIPQKLIFEIEKYIENPKKNKNCISFCQKLFYRNKEIKSAYKKNVLRLFKKGYAEFSNHFSFDIKSKNSKIHKIKPGKKTLNACILKYKKNNIEKDLNLIIEKNKNLIKISSKKSASIFFEPIFKFLNQYFIKGSIFDGLNGFIYAKQIYIENFIFQIMLQEKLDKEEKNDIW